MCYLFFVTLLDQHKGIRNLKLDDMKYIFVLIKYFVVMYDVTPLSGSRVVFY